MEGCVEGQGKMKTKKAQGFGDAGCNLEEEICQNQRACWFSPQMEKFQLYDTNYKSPLVPLSRSRADCFLDRVKTVCTCSQ